ncbi:type IV pilus assembly protein PilF [Vulcaniibacterium tengchongense]|uniref:Type IV pilus assembly protein PilF n=2 Tax=Vulcaniibacterium tengchongense TaxID=1273429 RepID=A0A3N4VJV5_9GAMM|nr:type IV pilus assembly protein PilF [Vulcaniibacterium tengchongense]
MKAGARRMRGLRGLAVALALVAAAGACNRLTFVRPDFSRGDFQPTARQVEVSDRKRDPAERARERLQLAQERYLVGDHAAAEREARQVLKALPRSAEAYALLAAVADRRGEDAKAGELHRRSVELAPTSGPMLNNYGVWLCGHGREAESLAWFDRALADPGYSTPAVALANAGRCAWRAGQGERAERDLRRALALDPQNPVALGALAELEFARGNALSARAFSERRLAAAPADREALLLASQIEQKLGDTAAAARYVQRLRAEFPDARNSGDGGRR